MTRFPETPVQTPWRAVLFDRDDTLSLTNRDVYAQAARWLHERHGLDPREAGRHLVEQWTSVEGRWQHLRTLQDEERFWEEYSVELAARLGLRAQDAAAMLSEWPYWRFLVPVPGVREVLTELRHRGLRVGVLSNTLPNVQATLEAIGVADLVDVALSTCALGVHKPDPQAFKLAAERLGVPIDTVVFVDDRPENVQAARDVGMHALLIDHAAQLADAVHSLEAVLDAVTGEAAA